MKKFGYLGKEFYKYNEGEKTIKKLFLLYFKGGNNDNEAKCNMFI